LKDGRIINVLGEPDDPVQAGGFCVKGPMMTQLVYNRFRLTQPMKRVAGSKGSLDSKFEPISWSEALDTIAAKFLALRDAGEARAIANKTSGRLPRGTGSLVGRYFTKTSPNGTEATWLQTVEEVPTANLFAVNIIRDVDLQYTF
jgi:anaerobic selenocysteine-containing dehydrogenase